MLEEKTNWYLRYPGLTGCQKEIEQSIRMLIQAFEKGHRLYICGNGGSAADADHIVGELMKGFLKKRPLSSQKRQQFKDVLGEEGAFLSAQLMEGLPAVSLHSQGALLTAFMNDENPTLVYAQALYAMGQKGDVLLAISTSGKSENVLQAARVAKALGISVIALTGRNPCPLDSLSDCTIHVGAAETYRIQELHLPVYHRLCAEIEAYFYEV